MARPSSLERRVSAMLNARLNRTPITRTASLAIVIAILGLTLPLAGLVASAQTTPATFSGALVDAVGRVLPNVKLVLANVDSKQKYEAQSDDSRPFRADRIARRRLSAARRGCLDSPRRKAG